MVSDTEHVYSEDTDDALFFDDAAEESSGECVEYAYTAGAGQGDRLDKFLMAVLPEGIVSREKLKAAIRDGLCSVDGSPCAEPKTKIITGQSVAIRFVHEATSLIPAPLSLEYIYKDTTLVVVNKPYGLTVHPCPSCDETTLVHGVAYDFPQLANIAGMRPGIVHRLDKDTSGLMIVALREDMRLRLAEAFAERRVSKTYLTIVCGIPAKSGKCTEPIGRHPTQRVKMAVKKSGRAAHTEWERLYADPDGNFSLLAVTIHTGRTHQIRVHMTHLGHPLVGDSVYIIPKWSSIQKKAARQMLHAWKLSFTHPESEELKSYTLPMPNDMRQTLLQLGRTTVRVVLTGCPGCGKSTALKYFAEQGIPVFSADEVVAQLYEYGQAGQKTIARFLGSKFIEAATGRVQRRVLFEAIQKDDALRDKLNKIIHPLVFDKLSTFWDQAIETGQQFAIAEIPLWTETRQNFIGEESPMLIGVSCQTTIRHQRLQQTREWADETCAHMDSWQLTEDQKFTKAHIIITNNGTPNALSFQLKEATHKLQEVYVQRNKLLLGVIEKFS